MPSADGMRQAYVAQAVELKRREMQAGGDRSSRDEVRARELAFLLTPPAEIEVEA